MSGLLAAYDARMLSRRNWINDFVGYVLRGGLSDDPDWAFDTASELHPKWGRPESRVAAVSASVRRPSSALLRSSFSVLPASVLQCLQRPFHAERTRNLTGRVVLEGGQKLTHDHRGRHHDPQLAPSKRHSRPRLPPLSMVADCLAGRTFSPSRRRFEGQDLNASRST